MQIRMNFFQIYQKLRISCTKFTCEFAYEFVHEFAYEFVKTKEKIRTRISEIRARILKEGSNLCTKLNKPTQLHQDRHSKTLYRSFQPTTVHVLVRIIHH